MSLIPPKIVIESTLQVGSIYKFDAPELITTKVPHFFIVIAIENDNNFLSVCTTQLMSKVNHLNHTGVNLDTLAYIKPSSENGLTKDTYVDCNGYHTITKEELVNKVMSKNFHPIGRLTIAEYDIILNSISISHTNDIPRFLLKYV